MLLTRSLRSLSSWAGMLCLACCPVAQAGETAVSVFNSYVMPPFVLEMGASPPGLASGLVEILNAELHGRFNLTLENVPRQRMLKLHLQDAASFAGLALFLAPPFVGDADQTRFHWTQPLFKDRHMLVFRAGKPPNVRTMADLQGMRVGVVQGNRYPALDDMVRDGQVTAEHAGSELVLLRNVALGRIDFAQISEQMYSGLAARPELIGRLQTIPQPQQQPFERRILVGKASPELAVAIDEAVARLPCNRQWQDLAREHHITLPPCLVAGR